MMKAKSKKKKWIKLRRVPPIHFFQFAILFLLCLGAYIQPNRLIIQIFLLVLIVCILDGIHFFAVKNRLRVDVNGGPPVEKHEIYQLQIQLVNHSNLPSVIFHIKPNQSQRLKSIGKNEVSALLQPKGILSYDLAYEAKLSGETNIGIEAGRLDSLFGFFRMNIPLEMYVKVRVFPEIREISEMDQFAHTLLGNESNERNGSVEKHTRMGEEVGYDLRPYQEGDSQKLIHWKLAALKGNYLVRQREGCEDQKQDIYFIICPIQQEESAEQSAIIQDKMVTSIASMAHYFLLNEQTVKVACYIHKSWKYMKLEAVSQIRELQELLSKYHSIEISTKVDERQIIKSLKGIMHEHQGMKILVSAYWDKLLQDVLVEEGEKAYFPVVWTCGGLPKQKIEEVSLPIWYINNSYVVERIQ